MPDQFFGLKYATLMAGFFGGAVYVAITEGLTKWQVITSLLIGVLTAGYLTPLISHYVYNRFDLPVSQEIENSIAFLIGLFALSVIPIVIRILKRKVDNSIPKGD